MKVEGIIDYARDYLVSKKLDAYEIYCLENNHFFADAKKGKIESLEDAVEVGFAFRVLNAHRLGFSYTTSLDRDRIKEGIDSAIEGSGAVDPDDAWSFVSPAKPEEFDWKYNDERLDSLSVWERAEAAVALEAAVMETDPRIKRLRRASYEESRIRIRLINYGGADLKFQKSLVSCDVMAVAESHGDSQWAWDFGFSHTFDGLDVEGAGRRAAHAAVSLLGAKNISTMKTPVCLHPFVAAQFLQALSKSFYGDNIYKSKSTLVGKLSETCYSEVLSIIDDGLLVGGYGSQPFDGEGSPCKTVTLIEKGVIKNWLTDSYWGKKLGMVSNSSSVRSSVKELPSIGVNNIYIQPSDSPRDSLLKEMKKGFYITSVIGAHTINSITGDFSVGAEGQWVEDGVASYPVKGVVIAGNINDIFKNVVAVANDLRFMGNVGSPTIMISDVQVGGT